MIIFSHHETQPMMVLRGFNPGVLDFLPIVRVLLCRVSFGMPRDTRCHMAKSLNLTLLRFANLASIQLIYKSCSAESVGAYFATHSSQFVWNHIGMRIQYCQDWVTVNSSRKP